MIGGVGMNGKPVSTVEEFDPVRESFSVTAVAGIKPRSRHTATLLSDGSVLIVGGLSASGKTRGDAQLWDPRTNRVTTGGTLRTPRSGQTATLLSDGNVLIEGGFDSTGTPVDSNEIFNPKLRQFSPATVEQSGETNATDSAPAVPQLAGSIPAANATGVAIDTMISLRFSEPIDVTTVDSNTVTLTGPDGTVSAEVVAAEGGMLVFVNPDSALAPSAAYTVTVDGVVAHDGIELAKTSFSFKTGSAKLVGPPAGTGSSSGASGEFNTAGVWIPTSDWQTHLQASPWQSLPALLAPKGVTALSGRVLTIDGNPLPNVTLQLGPQKVLSDATGRFLMTGVQAGNGLLLIDGTSANNNGRVFGIFEPAVLIQAHVTNVLSYVIWMPVLDMADAVTIPSPTTQETAVANPLMPGLELHIPAGTTITDINSKVVRTIPITPVPLDRPPFPLPAGVQVPIYFTIQPGGAQLWSSPGKWALAQLYYPNPGHFGAGTQFDFWNYNPSGSGWYVYGKGTVNQAGSEVVPNPGVGIWTFSGAMVGSPGEPPTTGDSQGDVADPVDTSTGIFRHSETDLRLADVIPIDFTRSYLSQDPTSRPFGTGFTDNYEIYITNNGAPNYITLDVVLPDGEKVHYLNNGNQGYWVDANYVATLTSDPSYYGSVITWDNSNNNGWLLRLKNGTIYSFPANGGSTAASALTGITDRYGNALTIARDSNSNITQITSPNGRWIQFQSDSNNRITQATDVLGRTVTYTYDTCGSGFLCSVKDANGGTTSYSYYTSSSPPPSGYGGTGNMSHIVDPRGNTEITELYDTNGRGAQQTLADGTSTFQLAYTLNGNAVSQTSITDPNQNVEQKSFDAKGFVTSDTYAHGVSGLAQTFTYTRDPGTELTTSMTDPLERETTYGYDANGNLTGITRLAGTQQAVNTTLVYDPTFSQLTSITDPLSHTWTLGRDGSGNLTSITDPLSHSISLTYDAEGRPLTVADAYNDTVQLGYSGADLATITDPLGNKTNRNTDSAGRLIGVRDALGQSTVITWDALNRITQITDPNSNATSFAYDGNSNLLSVTDANNNQTSYTYDSRNRLTSRADGLKVSESYGWDGNRNLTSHTDRRGKLAAFTYDALNRRTFAGFGQSGGQYESTISYAWDAGNRLTGKTDSIAGTITRVPDLLDRLTSETTPQGSISYSYDNANRRQTMQVAGQAQVSYTWDNGNRLTAIMQGNSAVGINYDNANRRTSLTLPNGVTVGYSVDNDSQVTGLTYSAGSTQLGNLTYGYDADGRVTSKNGTLAAISLPASVSGNAFNADNGMSAFNGATLSYDANGNLTSDGTNTYTWDARNHLTAISGGATASFVYDGFGRRANKTIAGTGSQFLYDGLNPVQELQGGAPSANLLTGLRTDEYFARTDSSNNVSTLLTDALGSTIGLVGSGQSIGTSYTYEPFGATTTAGATNGNSYQFTDRENDGTGLYSYRARYYSPNFQRFIAQDPMGFSGGDPNLYEYVRNSPPNYTDPLGLLVGTIGVSAGGQWGPFGGNVSVGIAIDDSGHIAVYAEAGGGGGAGAGETAGLSVGIYPTATCVNSIGGAFGTQTFGAGAGVGANVDTFEGKDPSTGKPIFGWGMTVGEGLGAGGNIGGSYTVVSPGLSL
ncbi:MAG: RHS repeat-associated core domain-containing protein [Candidatus Binatus sp.]